MKIYWNICLISNLNIKIIRRKNFSKKVKNSSSSYHPLRSKEIKHLESKYWNGTAEHSGKIGNVFLTKWETLCGIVVTDYFFSFHAVNGLRETIGCGLTIGA